MTKIKFATFEDIQKFKDEIKTTITESEIKILGELQDIRDESETHQFSHMRVDRS